MSGHTPAPWQIRTLENFGFNIVHYVGGDKFDIHRVAKAGEEANARLIAAAPELLEALEELLAVCEMTTFSDAYPQECEAARAAIAKAKRESATLGWEGM